MVANRGNKGENAVQTANSDTIIASRYMLEDAPAEDHMKNQYRVVVIGGGVVGASVLYHLAKFG